MMMQMLLSAGFPEKLLEKHSQTAFRNVFFKKKEKKYRNPSEQCQPLEDLKEWPRHKKWRTGVK